MTLRTTPPSQVSASIERLNGVTIKRRNSSFKGAHSGMIQNARNSGSFKRAMSRAQSLSPGGSGSGSFGSPKAAVSRTLSQGTSAASVLPTRGEESGQEPSTPITPMSPGTGSDNGSSLDGSAPEPTSPSGSQAGSDNGSDVPSAASSGIRSQSSSSALDRFGIGRLSWWVW